MFCPKCGQLLADGVKVCINCENVVASDDDEKTVHIEKESRPVVIDDDECTMRLSDVYGTDSTVASNTEKIKTEKHDVIESDTEDEEGTALLSDSSGDEKFTPSDEEVKKTDDSSTDVEEGTALLSEDPLGVAGRTEVSSRESTSFVGYQSNQSNGYGQYSQYQSNPGYAQNGFQTQQQNYDYSSFSANNSSNYKSRSVSFGEAIKLFFVNYVNFSGRASKSEYWWAFLFNIIISTVLAFIPFVGEVLVLGLLIPGISVGVRRLHDVGRNGTYLFMGLIPIAGAIILIIEFCKDSTGDNQWGSSEK